METENWSVEHLKIGDEQSSLIVIDGAYSDPESVIEDAASKDYARITPYYPGIRAAVSEYLTQSLMTRLQPVLQKTFGHDAWAGEHWYSIVTTPPEKLAPIQRLPHVDGTDPDQIAYLAYLHRTGHGGTGFFRNKSTGFETITADRFPTYQKALHEDVGRHGLPAARYNTQGEPIFTRFHEVEGLFNRLIIYRGNLLHSGLIDNDADLSPDPRIGRLTVNGFLRPTQ